MKADMTRELPLVSIIIPVYNGSNFLADAIESALNQTYGNIEIIVINDGSSDNGATERVAVAYGNKIRYFLKKNGGVASALNYGIQKMTGDYVSWLSHDDLYEATKIEEEVDYLFAQPNPENTVVACNSFAFYQNGMKKKKKINQYVFENYFDIFLGASAKVGVNGCSLLIPRHLLNRSTQFREDLPVTQDYDLWYRLKDSAKFVLLDKSLVGYRHHDMQDSVQKTKIIHIAGDELRSNILREVSNAKFANFMAHKTNEKWIWENYSTYKSKNYVKAPIALLGLLAAYYGGDSKQRLRVESEMASYENIFYTNSNKTKHLINTGALSLRRINILLDSISESDYKISEGTNGSKAAHYIESIKSDGLLFFIEKALRKLGRILLRKKR